MKVSQPVMKGPGTMGRFPFTISLICGFCLAAILGAVVQYFVEERFCYEALKYEYEDPEKPIWLKEEVIDIISGAFAGALAILSMVCAVVALRRPRVHPIRTGWIAIASFVLLGLPVGVASMIAFQESTTVLLGSARFGIAPVIGLVVGAVIAYVFNAWARRRWA